jgi:hypothetical protein
MYCSDCHGENTPDTSIGGAARRRERHALGAARLGQQLPAQGRWNSSVGADNRGDNGPTRTACASSATTRTPTPTATAAAPPASSTADRGNLHAYHTDKIERMRCNWCHVAVPHGWKNKALLVNLNDVGEEAGQPAGNREWRMNASSRPSTRSPTT